jgi:glycosyltransferase involved in cell wall biosynthesis
MRQVAKRILEIGNWPPPVCGWSMSLVGLRRELEARGWDCPVMNLNENRRVRSPEYIDVQNGWDYFQKVLWHMRRGYGVHVRVNGESKKGYVLALAALLVARIHGRPALLTYCGGHQQSYFPAPRVSFRHWAFAWLFRIPSRIYCNSDAVKQALLTTGINPVRVLPIPHFSTHYVEFTTAALPPAVEDFGRGYEGTFFVYLCYRKEYTLEFFAEAMRRFRAHFPGIGFLLVGTSAREVGALTRFLKEEKLEDATYITGSVPHDLFLTMLSRSLAYIRVPLTDGVCSSVLESLTLKVPVLASDNGTRPLGVELWQAGDIESLLNLMTAAVSNRESMVARIPAVPAEDNIRKLADDLEAVCLARRRDGDTLLEATTPVRSEAVRSTSEAGD